MLRITHVISGLGVGGAERALYGLLSGGLQEHYENHVISLTDDGAFGPMLRMAGVKVDAIGMPRGRIELGAVAKLLRTVRAGRPDILQGWMYHGNIAASLARGCVARPSALAWNIRTSALAKGQQRALTKLLIESGKMLARGPNAIVYNSRKSQFGHVVAGYPAEKSVLIPNGFDTCYWRPREEARSALRRLANVPPNKQIIGFVGRGHPLKDLPNLFGAFRVISRSHPECHLVCIGRDLTDFAPSDIDRARLTFLGEREDVAHLMSGLDLLCLSSSAEGFPNVIGEAMACGVPCVTTDVGDAADIVGSTGWVVPSLDSEALARALGEALDICTTEAQERSRAARIRIETCYSLSSTVAKYVDLYRNIELQKPLIEN